MEVLDNFSPAQLRTAVLVARGLTNSQVATRLYVSVNTVKTHVARCLAVTATLSKTHMTGRVMLDAEFRDLYSADRFPDLDHPPRRPPTGQRFPEHR